MKRTDADLLNQRSHSSAETRNAVSHAQAAESLHEISVKTPTLRDYFAAKAMQGELSGADPLQSVVNIATRAYAIADAMLKARE